MQKNTYIIKQNKKRNIVSFNYIEKNTSSGALSQDFDYLCNKRRRNVFEVLYETIVYLIEITENNRW